MHAIQRSPLSTQPQGGLVQTFTHQKTFPSNLRFRRWRIKMFLKFHHLIPHYGMESKLGENFLSLQCKDRAIYPPPTSIFTGQCYLYRRKSSDPFPFYLYIEIFHPVLTPSLRSTMVISCLTGAVVIFNKLHVYILVQDNGKQPFHPRTMVAIFYLM